MASNEQSATIPSNDLFAAPPSNTTNSTIVGPNTAPSVLAQLMNPTTEPQKIFYHRLLARVFFKECTCETHAEPSYLNYPYSCSLIHFGDEILIIPHQRPCIIVGSRQRQRPYEALQLVSSATQYFSRPEGEMDPEQQASLKYIRKCFSEGDLDNLGAEDARLTFSVDSMTFLVTHLLFVFFFGAEIPLDVFWKCDFLDRSNWLGATQTRYRDGNEYEAITIHPKRMTTTTAIAPNQTYARALQRLGTFMHELIHAVLKILACRQCVVSTENLAHHGRAWQRLALAIEREFLKLFGLQLDLGRMNGVTYDMDDSATGCNHPSVHDLVMYGFVEGF
jgi:hypothetical protein